MEHITKISKLFKDSTASKFAITKLIGVNDLSSCIYSANKNIKFKTSVLRSDLCDYSNVCIVLKGRTNVRGTNDAKRIDKKVNLKNTVSFRSYIWKINNTVADIAEDIDMLIVICKNIVAYVLWH